MEEILDWLQGRYIATYSKSHANVWLIRNLLLSIIRARQEQVMSVSQIDHLSKRLDVYLGHKSPAVIETTLITVGRIARYAISTR